MAQLFTIQDDKILINKLVLTYLEGTVNHAGQFNLSGPLNVDGNIKTTGSISADTIKVKNLITESGSIADAGNWVVNAENDLIGKGFSWAWGDGNVRLSYQHGNRLSISGGNLDLAADSSYRIDDTEVVTLNSLGPTVVKSNLKELGNLKSLNVIGDAVLGEFAYFGSGFGRLGLNTDEPNGALSIVENDVEIIAGAPTTGRAQIGTYTAHDLSIITNNTNRITVKHDGKVVFGDATTKTANVTIYGTLNVETLVADNRIERYSSLEIKSSRDTNIYGKGVIWTGGGTDRQLVMLADPDRLWSTESIDLAGGQSYFINTRPVLNETALGDGVVDSNLTSVGTLKSLTVNGEVNLLQTLNVSSTITATELTVSNNNKKLTINGTKLNTNTDISVSVLEDEAFYADVNEIAIGNKNNTRKPVKMFGPVAVGIANTELDADFTVAGSVKFSGKKFITGTEAPIEGSYNKGDICWNDEPQLHSYIGWVCVNSGSPGTWIPFGSIGR